MGNSVYKSKADWNFDLDFEQPNQNLSIVAGNNLKGKIIVKVKDILPPTRLSLQLKGAEKTTVVKGGGKNRTTHHGVRILCKATALLREEGQVRIHPGTYVFPFDIALPDTLPSSHHGPDGRYNNNKGRFSIYYRLSIDAEHNRKTTPKVAQRYFSVASAPLPNELVPALVSPQALRVESFGFNRGTLGVAARVVDVHVGRGDDLKIYLACRNDATASVYQVEIELIETVRWRANNGRQNDRAHTVASIPDVRDIPGIIRKKRDKDVVREEIRQRISHTDELQDLYYQLQMDENLVRFRVPSNCHDTYNGPLITTDHRLKITMHTHTNISNPSINIPLRIGFPPSAPPPRPSPPPARAANGNDEPYVPHAFSVGQEIPVASIRPAAGYIDGNDSIPIATMEALPVINLGGSDRAPRLSVRDLPDATIPMADAILIPTNDAIQAPMTLAPRESLILGGVATFHEENEPPIAPTAGMPLSISSSVPDLSVLLQEMAYSINDFEIVCRRIRDENWSELLSRISPNEFGSILAHVNLDSDQPRVAAVLAHNHHRFICEYIVAAIQNTAEWNRAAIVQRLVYFCVDLVDNNGLIREALTEWDLVVVRSTLEEAIEQRRRPPRR